MWEPQTVMWEPDCDKGTTDSDVGTRLWCGNQTVMCEALIEMLKIIVTLVYNIMHYAYHISLINRNKWWIMSGTKQNIEEKKQQPSVCKNLINK